jgi:hypothetical protein
MAPSAMASAAASSSAAVSSGSPPMAYSASSTSTPAFMMATTTPPRPTKRNKQSPDRYYGHHPGVAYHHHPHSYGNPLLSPAMTTSSVSPSSACNSPFGFDARPPSPGNNLLMRQHMPPLEQSNFVTPITELFRHRFPPLEDPHYYPHQQQQQQYRHQYHHQYDHHPEFLQHHPYNPSSPPRPPRYSAPTMPSTLAVANMSPPQAESNGNRGMSTMTTSTGNSLMSPIRGPSPFRRGGGIRDGANTNINNSGGHSSGIQQSPLRRSTPGKHSFNLDNSSDSRSEALENASMNDLDTDSYWNDPLLAIMLKPSMDRDALSRGGGELGVTLAAPPLVGLSKLGSVENAASGSASPTRSFHARLETLQQTIRNVILRASPTDQSALMAMVTSWASRLSQDPLGDNTSAAITMVRLPKTTLSASVSSASLDTTTSNALEHPSYTRDEQQQESRSLPVLAAAAATMHGNSNDSNQHGNHHPNNHHPQQQLQQHPQNSPKVPSLDATSVAPTAAVSMGRNDGPQQMSMIVSPTGSAASASAFPNQMASV